MSILVIHVKGAGQNHVVQVECNAHSCDPRERCVIKIMLNAISSCPVIYAEDARWQSCCTNVPFSSSRKKYGLVGKKQKIKLISSVWEVDHACNEMEKLTLVGENAHIIQLSYGTFIMDSF